MKFVFPADFLRTAQWLKQLEIPPIREIILSSFDQKFVGFGSCFAMNLQAVLQPYHLSFWFNREICAHYVTNTLLQTLKRASGIEPHLEDELFRVNENPEDIVLVNYWKLRFFGPNALATAREAREKLDQELLKHVAECDIFIITLGNSLIFRPKTRCTIPCNLYGLTFEDFDIYSQTPEDVESDLNEIHSALLHIRNGKPFKMLISVSPQRYLYDPVFLDCSALENNCLMKSVLRVAVNRFVKSKLTEGVFYFPAYEMVIDELRLYETLSTYDHMHINQDFTPRYVVKKFLKRHASDDVLGVFPIIEGFNELIEETELDQSRGAQGTHPSIVEHWVDFFMRLVAASSDVFPRQLWTSALTFAGRLGIAGHLKEALSGEILSNDVKAALSEFFYEMEARQNGLDTLIAKTINSAHGRKIAIFGAGALGLSVCRTLFRYSVEPVAIFDNNPDKWNNTCGHVSVCKPYYKKIADCFILIAAARHHKDIAAELESQGLREGDAFMVFSADEINLLS